METTNATNTYKFAIGQKVKHVAYGFEVVITGHLPNGEGYYYDDFQSADMQFRGTRFMESDFKVV